MGTKILIFVNFVSDIAGSRLGLVPRSLLDRSLKSNLWGGWVSCPLCSPIAGTPIVCAGTLSRSDFT